MKRMNPDIRLLADRLLNKERPVLFLGAGCSIGAGLPGERELIKQIAENLALEIDSLEGLAEILKDKTDLCLQIRKQLPIPEGVGTFEKLASLIAEGFFHTILTTNWDFLIESSLANFLPPDAYKVYVRGEVSDEIIANALQREHPRIKIVKLHGDALSLPIINSKFLMRLEPLLDYQLNNMMCADGVVIVGSGLKELRFQALLRNSKPVIIDPEPHDKSFLNQLGAGAVQVCGEDGKFENFVDSVCDSLLATKYRGWLAHAHGDQDHESRVLLASEDRRGDVDDIVRRIRNSLRASNFSDTRVKEFTRRILRQIREQFGDSNVCLVFIRDPSAPGGDEIERLIRSDAIIKTETAGLDMAWVQMNNRVTDKGIRKVETDSFKVNKIPIERLAKYHAVVLVDSVAFTGHTLEVARDHLSADSGRPKDSFTAALLLLPAETRDNLIKVGKWWDVISEGKGYTNFQVTFPWGWTTATQHVQQRPADDPFIPGEGFAYTPKPWGDHLGLSHSHRSSVSLLLLQRGQRTSTHYHVHRDETFVVLDNRLRICVWDHYLELNKHESIGIPRGVPHSLIALDQPCRVLEIATGHYDVGNDIVRLVDIYGRGTRPDGSDDGLI